MTTEHDATPVGKDPRRTLLLGMSPCGMPGSRVPIAVSGAGGLGVVDLGDGGRDARDALLRAVSLPAGGAIGIRVTGDCALSCDAVLDLLGDKAERIDTVVLGADSSWQLADVPDRYLVLVEVTSAQHAVAAVTRGADGVIAKGVESGGRVSESGAFVLLQQLLRQGIDVPVWLCGGIGSHTAAAAVAGGAAGVVLDTQLALLPESDLPDDVRAAIAASDGTDTTIDDGVRVLISRHGRVLPVGQDAFLASRFAESYGSVARAVRAVLCAIHDVASEHANLGAGSAMAAALGTELPVVQGPMTRVSDQAGFAAAVAAEGGLPMLALALSTAEQTSALLERTRDELGEQPWGVGVLGFAPQDVRNAQLDVIKRVRPSSAIIAGGRPDQARVLEAEGITTFLHVPSPGLLAQFLDAGARGFVFEGSECGGHIGPRTSFALWEAQLGVLLDHIERTGTGDDVQVLFAGGIHDERSAAMVSALAAPLARQGVAVGVLLGTGYLFTEEAVTHGAVGTVFQRQVLAAEHTELLETAPGHATRCVASPFTTSFRATVDELSSNGVEQRDAWERLEQLNVGRLRIASKGLWREGDELVTVDEAEQRELGLFMAGQVATLRDDVTTIDALHASVTSGAAAFLDDRAATLRGDLGQSARVSEPDPLDIAIVGMACTYPGADDLAGFWSQILANADVVTEVPRERWNPDVYYAAPDTRDDPPRGDWTPSKWGGFLADLDFDPLAYGIPPSALAAIEPVQLIALRIADQALADAGGRIDRERTGVLFAAAVGSDLANAKTLRMVLPSYLGTLPPELDEQLPLLGEDSLPGRLGSVVAGRIANRLDLGGMNYTIDAACASSLATVDAACKELATGNSDVMVCGSADLHNAIEDFLLFASVGALSPTGRCKPFDSTADGIALSEGVSCVVLKRLGDAERDGDRIYGVIKGVGGGSDGKALGLTAPRPEGQRRALDRAYHVAGVSPAEVGLIEAHGTGTVVGDRTELETLTGMFDAAGAARGSCVLGSVKSQIGHTKCAAGLAGLIKIAMSVYTGVKPPTRGIAAPNPGWDSGTSPFVFHETPSPWLVEPERRYAGVSAFGFGGTNFHIVVSGHPSARDNRHGLHRWPAELFTFPGTDDVAAHRRIERLLTLIETNSEHGEPWTLRDLAKTVSAQASVDAAPVRIAVVARDIAELAELLRAALRGESDPERGLFRADGAPEGALAMLFPGQGSQRPGMLAELFVAFPELHRFAGDDADVRAALFPPAAFGQDAAREQAERLRDTRMAQPALGITGLAAHELLRTLGVTADSYAGHSYGELVALGAAGACDVDTLLALSSARAEAILSAAGDDPGAMAAVSTTSAEARRAIDAAGATGHVVVANDNAPGQVVISGATEQLAAVLDALDDQGIAAKRLPVACAFHSPVIDGAGERFAAVLDEHHIGALDRPVWSNRTAAPYPADADVAAELAAQVSAPVRFAEQIDAMYADGVRTFVEAGQGRVLSGLVTATLGDRPHTVVSLETPGHDGISGLLTALARLAVAGVPVRTGPLFTGRDARDVSGVTPPRRPGWVVNGATVRTADGQIVPGGLAPARPIEDITVTQSAPSPGANDDDALVSDFLRTSRELIAAQRDVLLSYFGTSGRQDVPPLPVSASPRVTAAPEPHAESAADEHSAESALPTSPDGAGSTDGTGGVDVLTTVIEVIAQRTGYPVDMISPDLDLEADLSVDSIKRTEIAGELNSRLRNGELGGQKGELAHRNGELAANKVQLGADKVQLADRIEELAQARTAAAMADVLAPSDTGTTRNGARPEAHPVPAPTEHRAEASAAARLEPRVGSPARYVLDLANAAAEEADPTALVGANIVIAGGDDLLADEVAAELSARGAMPFVIGDADEVSDVITTVDGVISLHATALEGDPVLPATYPLFRSAALREPRWLLAAARIGFTPLPHAAGLRGLARTLRREYPDTTVRLAEFDREADRDELARGLVGELLSDDDEPVVTHSEHGRHAFRLVPAALGTTGSDPAGAAEVRAMGLDADSVVVLIGGARGITARVAAALAAATGCRIELAGRTALPTEPEDPAIAAATDLPSLRTALATNDTTPAEIDRAAKRILAQREVATTLAELRATGSEVTYHTVDARDAESIRHLVKAVHAEHGRIDGVVYAAGVIEDRLVADKDPDSFTRVYGTKVDGAAVLLGELARLPTRPKFAVLFGSIAATFGNRGQADYASANDALDTLGTASSGTAAERTVTVHWGPWAPGAEHGGMVSAELARDYAERGITLIDAEDGVACLLRELAWGSRQDTSVVYTASEW
ncbi:type I polyketide synthase [Haloechinothrix halophila]|uniref:type I polyketide synthase n=1 Tax=Haloechinothrix halophila TaxID=1069073 RepID=UPI0003FD5901|nr:type I polyketide synthase [Haloechinothrix halophila]